jgi:hypothetical protein
MLDHIRLLLRKDEWFESKKFGMLHVWVHKPSGIWCSGSKPFNYLRAENDDFLDIGFIEMLIIEFTPIQWMGPHRKNQVKEALANHNKR